MTLEEKFPFRYLINLGERGDRRIQAENEFLKHNLIIERFPAINKRWLKSSRGFEDTGRYALALTQRLAIRKAKQHGAKSVLSLIHI